MSILKKSTGLMALIFAAVLAFAFSPKPVVVKGSPKATTWVKYNCAQNGQVAIIQGGNTSASGYPECTGTNNICARQFNTTDLVPISGQPNNYQPKSGAVVLNTVRCP